MSLIDEVTVLYEDDDVVVINKPSGLIVHPDGKRDEGSLVDWILTRCPDIGDVGEPLTLASGTVIQRPGIVHRLDRETSGALLVCKNQKSYIFFKKQFKEKDIAKKYHVFVYGKVKLDRGSVDRPIGKSRSDFRQWSAQRGARGEMREATTDYTVMKRNKDATFLEARPKTGRTHQIRVHFKAINHPVVCDSLYAPKHAPLFGFKRLALHAYTLEFKTLDGESKKVEAPYPQDFANALKEFEKTM